MELSSSDVCPRLFSGWLLQPIISAKAPRASVRNLLFKPACPRLPRGSCYGSRSLVLFIRLRLCGGVTPSFPSHVNTLRQRLSRVPSPTHSGFLGEPLSRMNATFLMSARRLSLVSRRRGYGSAPLTRLKKRGQSKIMSWLCCNLYKLQQRLI